jgi:purine-binding chemotaxis protein CheW
MWVTGGNIYMKQYVIFGIENEKFGIEIEKVNSIEKPLEIFKVPNTPEFFEGLINLRDKVYPVVNMRKRFHLTYNGLGSDCKIIITNLGNMAAGFIVDAVSEILRLEDSQIEQTPPALMTQSRQYINGIAKTSSGIILLIDPLKILSREELEFATSEMANLSVDEAAAAKE